MNLFRNIGCILKRHLVTGITEIIVLDPYCNHSVSYTHLDVYKRQAMHSFMQKENLKKMVITFTPLLESPYRIILVVPVIKILSPVFIWHPNKFNFCCPELPLAFLNLNGHKVKYLVCRMAMAILLHNSFLFPATYITTSRKY